MWLVAGVALVAAIARLLLNRSEGEPAYQGRTLTQWLKRLDDGEAGGISSRALPSLTPRQEEAAKAIRAMGTEALPWLMRDLHARPREDALRFRIERGVNGVLQRAFGTRVWFADVTQEDRIRWRAAQGLAALGPLAQPQIPELQRLLLTNFFHSSIKEAAYALAAVGPEGIAILTNAPQENEWSGMCAIWALGQHPAAGTNAISFLCSAALSPSEGTACGAIQVLELFHTAPAQVIPVLTAALASPKPAVRADAARALGAFGPPAVSAVPQLEALTNDPSAAKAALSALRQVQQSGAPKAR